MIINYDFTEQYNSPVRNIVVNSYVYNNNTSLKLALGSSNKLKELTIDRIGENKFFGFGICNRLNIKLIDDNSTIGAFDKGEYIKISFRYYDTYDKEIYDLNTSPFLYVTETHRDEKTNELSITAYDLIYFSDRKYVGDLAITPPYTINEFAIACGELMGIRSVSIDSKAAEAFNLSYENGANFEGTETIREALNAVAEATQTIYYINHRNQLVFKRLDMVGNAVFTIDKEKYIELESGDNRRLSAICHATELGDNVTASLNVTGTTQYIRDNPFWELREDIGELVENALAAVGGLTINKFNCQWRGNPVLEIGDKIALERKDGSLVYSYVLNDTIFYDGSLSQTTEWSYEDSEETESNPANLGDALKQTFARVDKVNKQIDLVVSQTEENKEQLSNLQLTTENITASVEKIETNVNTSLESINSGMTKLTSRVEQSITAEDLTIEVQTQLSNGVDKVETSTGFTFNEEGLTVSKTGSEMETTITEDGMTVYRDEEAVLTANNVGVNATNLHATTYLIVGVNSRFEDFGDDRTGCFWIGGNS